ncbi:DUF3307 domain-containing protein [Lentzea tibetensis]|uniref:DUF3307 domain-containing protein n=1 Tax=Lentzea tibetensis TaxID=2591470 RepID=A0A563EUS7_9PSEU|nr:DUF3307 domain-containing protein [Lentzea tibetensis]TWP51251.1 DUF3307 domain-containing protein [Lentzea tibetensis]
MHLDTAVTFAAVSAALYAGHHVGDYWLQTPHQGKHKGDCGREGWLAAGRHVATYTIATAVAVALVAVVIGLPISPAAFVVGQLVSAATHLVIDRRYPLRALAALVDRVQPGKLDYYDNGGAAHLDQSAHIFCLFVAALLTAAL